MMTGKETGNHLKKIAGGLISINHLKKTAGGVISIFSATQFVLEFEFFKKYMYEVFGSAGLIAIVALFLYLKSIKKIEKDYKCAGVFTGLKKLDKSWEADKQKIFEKDLVSKLNQKKHCVIMVGASSIGKTTFIKNWIKEERLIDSNEDGGKSVNIKEEDVKYIDSSNYQNIKSITGETDKKLYIFDQFEDYLDNYDDLKLPKYLDDDVDKLLIETRKKANIKGILDKIINNTPLEEKVTLVKYIKDLIDDNKEVIFILNKKRYFKLKRFFGEINQNHDEYIEFSGFTNNNDSLLSRFKTVCSNKHQEAELHSKSILSRITKKDSDVINPLEANIIGCSISFLNQKAGKKMTSESFSAAGEKAGVFKAFFDNVITSGEAYQTEVVSDILYTLTLSKNNKFKSVNDFKKITNHEKKVVENTLKNLTEKGLLEAEKGDENFSYRLEHPSLKYMISKYVSPNVKAVQKDNIRYFIDLDSNHDKGLEEEKNTIWQAILFWLVILVCAYRLINPTAHWDAEFDPNNITFDFDYWYILLCHGLWVLYVSLLYKHFFHKMVIIHGNSTIYKITSAIMVISAYSGMLLGAFIDMYWLWSIVIGGMSVAINLGILSIWYIKRPEFKKRIQDQAKESMINMLVVSGLALGLVHIIIPALETLGNINNISAASTNPINIINLVLATGLSIFALMSINWHTTRSAVARRLGAAERSKAL